jgi:hypothetical protein
VLGEVLRRDGVRVLQGVAEETRSRGNNGYLFLICDLEMRTETQTIMGLKRGIVRQGVGPGINEIACVLLFDPYSGDPLHDVEGSVDGLMSCVLERPNESG